MVDALEALAAGAAAVAVLRQLSVWGQAEALVQVEASIDHVQAHVRVAMYVRMRLLVLVQVDAITATLLQVHTLQEEVCSNVAAAV